MTWQPDSNPLNRIERDVCAMWNHTWLGRLFLWMERHGIR